MQDYGACRRRLRLLGDWRLNLSNPAGFDRFRSVGVFGAAPSPGCALLVLAALRAIRCHPSRGSGGAPQAPEAVAVVGSLQFAVCSLQPERRRGRWEELQKIGNLQFATGSGPVIRASAAGSPEPEPDL